MSSIKIPDVCLAFKDVYPITFVGKQSVTHEELFHLYIGLENYLRRQPDVFCDKRTGQIVGCNSNKEATK